MSFLRRVRNKVQRKLNAVLNAPVIDAPDLKIGKGVLIEPGVRINCRRLVLGDGVTIRAGTRIDVSELVIGDYTEIHGNCILNGDDWCEIGNNCWIGDYSLVNSTGTASIGNGVGIGAHSQLWSHIYFGDVLEGCRFASEKPLVVEDDVWFVGHCIVSPVHAQSRSMAMVGSVITKDMAPNHVYAGVPAKDVTDRMGGQFQERTLAEKRAGLESHLEAFLRQAKPAQNRIRIVDRIEPGMVGFSQFSLSDRLYWKHLYPEEVAFIRYLTPTRAKFNPHPDTDWVKPLRPSSLRAESNGSS